MTLKEFMEGLNTFAKKNPDALDLQVVASKDDEGNGYNPIIYPPTKGIYEDREFLPVDEYDDWGHDESETNAVCVN